MRYKVGDKVWLRDDLVNGRYYGEYFASRDVINHVGKCLTIKSATETDGHDRYGIEESGCFVITDGMIDHDKTLRLQITQEKSSAGDTAEISIDGKEKLFSPGGGCKTDGDKLMLQLIEPEFLERMAEILTAGAKKYSAYNWRGLDKSRVVGSLMRHLNSYRKGEVMDDQYPFGSNLAAIAVNAMFLDWMENNQTEDGFVEDER